MHPVVNMNKIRISVVSYLNSLPFAYCLEHSNLMDEIELSYDIPSQCADKLLSNRADIGLIPIVEALRMQEYHIVSGFCIGTEGAVRTVVLASETPLQHISTVYLDYHSRSSVSLAKILATHFWNIYPEWIYFQGDITCYPRNGQSAAVIIGDKVFGLQSPYMYDLATEWGRFASLPFVFACWVSNKLLDRDFIRRFDEAMLPLSGNIGQIAAHYKDRAPQEVDLLDYWTNNISYPLTVAKRKGLDLFLQYAKTIPDNQSQV